MGRRQLSKRQLTARGQNCGFRFGATVSSCLSCAIYSPRGEPNLVAGRHNAVNFRSQPTCSVSIVELHRSYGTPFLSGTASRLLATPLGRIVVKHRPTASLLDDPCLVNWIGQLRSACRDKDKTPARYQTALRRIDRAIFEFANRSKVNNDASYFVRVLSAVGRAEQVLANGLTFCQDKYLRPLQRLSSQWLEQSDDGSTGIPVGDQFGGNPIVRRAWTAPNVSGRGQGRKVRQLVARQHVRRSGQSDRSRLTSRPRSAGGFWKPSAMDARRPRSIHPGRRRLSDVVLFLNEATNDEKLHDLIWGLIGVEYGCRFVRPDSDEAEVPFEFGVPRLLVEKRCFARDGGYWRVADADPNAKPEPEVFYLLMSGQTDAIQRCIHCAAYASSPLGCL